MIYEYEIGQRVIWRGSFGAGVPKPAEIVDRGEKNGKPVYDLDNGHWAYESQLEEMEMEPVGDELTARAEWIYDRHQDR